MNTRQTWLSVVVAISLPALTTPASATPSHLRFSIIKTAEAPAKEALLISGGSWTQTRTLNHVAVLIEHPKGVMMFDAGLSEHVGDEQQQDLNWLYRQWPLLAYRNLSPAKHQLPAGYTPDMIVLSHAHWDHVSGIVDFPKADVWASRSEMNFAAMGRPPAVLPGQVQGKVQNWKAIAFVDRAVCGFERSHDVYGDGSVLLVDMPGHTPGSVGLFLTTGKGRKLFFIGDTVWLKEAVQQVLSKPLISRSADSNPALTEQVIERLHACVEQQPEVELIPAHDSKVQDALGYYPRWTE